MHIDVGGLSYMILVLIIQADIFDILLVNNPVGQFWSTQCCAIIF